ncbi:PepSY domain-containing protein [Janibacter limosus]|uniref:PepSY domain-containing protein n=1 Tax=Janibacter limosus TaxID=53458 RepID=A0A4P6MTT0_9MICO|nr:PepSY domain-containing protein [Janibacter limosus]QBF45225.1 PepSY domain-containing protein [Janibacter limosus]
MDHHQPTPIAAPKQIGVGWWLLQGAGLAMTLGLMVVLAFALMMLTRMPVEGKTDPDVHWPTFAVWFVLCSVTVIGSMARSTWRELEDERVHVDVLGNELRIDRWSPPHERQRFLEQVAADTRARERAIEHQRSASEGDDQVATTEMTEHELRSAALRRREVGMDVPAAPPTGRWSRPLRLLRLTALNCLYGWLPLSLVVVVVLVELQDRVDPMWGLLPMLLLPIGWILMEAHQVLRHRVLRTRRSRSDLAQWHAVSGFVAAVVLALMAYTGVVMREDYPGIALVCFPLMVLCGWICKHELGHQIPSGPDRDPDVHDPPPDLSLID